MVTFQPFLFTVTLVYHLLMVSFTAVSNSISFWASWVLNSLISCFNVELCFNSMSSCSHLYKKVRKKFTEKIKVWRVWKQFKKGKNLASFQNNFIMGWFWTLWDSPFHLIHLEDTGASFGKNETKQPNQYWTTACHCPPILLPSKIHFFFCSKIWIKWAPMVELLGTSLPD